MDVSQILAQDQLLVVLETMPYILKIPMSRQQTRIIGSNNDDEKLEKTIVHGNTILSKILFN